jgi:hypothetical protein
VTQKAIGRLKEALGAPAAPSGALPAQRPAMATPAGRAELLQNASITAQVCVKAAARVAGAGMASGAIAKSDAEEFASNLARRFMDDAGAYIASRMNGKTTKMRRNSKIKEPKP